MPQLMQSQSLAPADVHDMFYSIVDRNATADTRLFLAIMPDTAAALRMSRLAESLKRAHRLSGEPIALDRLHVSLFFLGRLSGDATCAARAEEGELPIAPFEVRFDRTASFRGGPGRRPLVLIGGDGVEQLKSFRRRLGAWLVSNGFKRAARTNFEPHVTLLYDSCCVDEYPLAEPVCWMVKEMVLIQSRKGHTHLAKWRLRA
jgi:RNA 2',3'-cyclic 3'-phosphodiesterase